MSAGELRHHLSQLASVLARIDQRLTAIEAGLRAPTPTPSHGCGPRPPGLSLTPAQWLKLLAGLALPLAALMLALSGHTDAARKLLAP